MADTPGKPRIAQACRLRLVNCSGKKILPAAPSLWLTATQTPRSAAAQAGTAAAVVRAVSEASAAPDELVTVAAISPAEAAAAMTAMIRRAVLGMVGRYLMSCRPALGPGSAVCGVLCSLRLR